MRHIIIFQNAPLLYSHFTVQVTPVLTRKITNRIFDGE